MNDKRKNTTNIPECSRDGCTKLGAVWSIDRKTRLCKRHRRDEKEIADRKIIEANHAKEMKVLWPRQPLPAKELGTAPKW